AGDRVEAAPAVGKGADARQHHSVGAAHLLGIIGDHDRLVAPGLARSALERLGGRVQVAGAVIDDGDAHARAPGSGKRPMMPGADADGPDGAGPAGVADGGGAARRAGSATQVSKKRRSAASRSSATTTPRYFHPRRRSP